MELPRSPANCGQIPDASRPRAAGKSPANKPNSLRARAWIAPRRPPVRVRLAPLGEPGCGAGFRAAGGVAPVARQRFFGRVFGPIAALRTAPYGREAPA